MSTLQEITKLDVEVLKKIKLEAYFNCDPNQSENLCFLSPLVLLEDYDLKKGGYKDFGAKEILGRVTKDILKRKDDLLFQVPEIMYLHMGYGKKSGNKKGKMALTAEEGEFWRSFLDLSRFASCASPRSEESSSGDDLEEGEPREGSFSTEENRETHHLQQDEVPSGDSGLQIPLKGRYMLLFSILLMFFVKKKKKKGKRSGSVEAKIGLNEISDFMLFWILPYLLNFNHRKVQEVKKHHEVRGFEFLEFVKKSASEVIRESFASCSISDEPREVILQYYKKYYGTEQLDHDYDLFKTSDDTPLVLVPKRYIIKNMPVTLEDIGLVWEKFGRDPLFSEFIDLFIKDREIQKDFLYSLEDLKHRQGIDFAIILPDEPTFNELTGHLEEECADTFIRPKQIGRSLISPCIGLIKDQQKDLVVCFSFFQGHKSLQVSSLFRAVGAHYMDHFTLAILHGLCCNPRDPDFRVGNLYGVSRARKCSFRGSSLYPKGKKKDYLDFSQSIGRFCQTEFPVTYAKWEETVRKDDKVKKLMEKTKNSLKICPKFIRSSDLTVMYSSTSNSRKLRKNYSMRVVNSDGCLLSRISQCGRKDNTAVVLAIKDTFEGCQLPILQDAIKRIITHFIRAVFVAGLPNVYPVEPDAEDRERVECDSSSDEDLDDDQVEQASSNTVQKKGNSLQKSY